MLVPAETVTFSLPGKSSSKARSSVGRDYFLHLETVGADISEKDILKEIHHLQSILDKVKSKNLMILRTLKFPDIFSSVILGFVEGSKLHVKSIGRGEVLLGRDGKTGVIATGNEIVSGEIKEHDRLLIIGQLGVEQISREKRYEILQLLQSGEKDGSELEIELSVDTPHGVSFVLKEQDESQVSASPSQLPRPRILGGKLKEQFFNFLARLTHIEEDADPVIRKKKRMLLTIAIILTILLIASIFLNINQTSSTKQREKLSQALDLVSHQYDEAVSLIDLNPVRSRTLLSDSKLALTPLLSQFPKKSREYERINEWISKVSEKELVAYKIYKLTSVPLFFDIALIKADGAGSKIAGFESEKAILDSKNGVVYFFDSKTKKSAIIAGPDTVKNATTVAIHGKNAYIVNDDGVVAINSDSKIGSIVIKRDEKWGSISALFAFGGNLYLLDGTNNNIWKYISQEAGFLPRSNYVNTGVPVNFSQAAELTIDGSVWVLSRGGDIVRLTQGSLDPFTLKEFSESTSGFDDMSTSDTDTLVYFLDRTTSRILVFGKDGQYHSQYQWDELKNADDFIVTVEEKKIFVLIGSKIYAIDIQT